MVDFLKTEMITRSEDKPYLWRFTFFKNNWFGIMLHRFYSSDDVCRHTHPWPFISIILWGGYWEWTIDKAWRNARTGKYTYLESAKWHWPGSILFRPLRWIHRIEIGSHPVWTLIITGPRCQDWGFWTRAGFVPSNKYNHDRDCV